MASASSSRAPVVVPTRFLEKVRSPEADEKVAVIVLGESSPPSFPHELVNRTLKDALADESVTLLMCSTAADINKDVLEGKRVVLVAWKTNKAEVGNALAKVPSIEWVHSSSAGVEHILSPDLANHPSQLTNAKGAFSSSLGEWAVFGCMYMAKRVGEMVQSQKDRKWNKLTVQVG